jgi:fatty-acyl-CoA synthase
MNLADLVSRNAAFAPGKLAVACEGTELSYAKFSAQISALSRSLAERFGVAAGDRVAHLGLNSPELLVLLYACARLGAILVPMNWRLASRELVFIVGHAEPKVLAIEPEFRHHLDAIAAASPGLGLIGIDDAIEGALPIGDMSCGSGDDPAPSAGKLEDELLLVYTSGTTGRPKGALLTQDALNWNAIASAHMHGLTAEDHVLTVLPMFHVGGLNIQTTPALQIGATVTLHRRFDPGATLASIARIRPSLTVLVPATLQAILAHPDFRESDLSSLRAITTGSTVVPEALVEAFARRDVRLIQVYGATETGPVSAYERFDEPRVKRDTTGLAGLFAELRIVDEMGQAVPCGDPGEIAVKAPNLFSGYWRDRAATEAAFRDGFFLSGDIGVIDADGHLFVRDRKKNLIISGGENIYPAEIERVILEFPGIAECAVIGVPDPRWQERPVAAIVPCPGAKFNKEELQAHLAANLARFKLPREIVVRDSLPKNVMGKVQHFALKAELSGGPESSGQR